MDSIVNKLTEIEDAASAIVAHAETQKEVLDREYDEKRRAFDEDLEKQRASMPSGMSWRRILPVSLTARTGRARKRYARFRRNMKKSIPNTPTRSCAGSPRCSLWEIYLNTAGS